MAPAAGSKKKTKSKRSGVGIDFKKVKHKVGRKIPAPQNATKVEFKSKKIVLHEQSVKVDKDGLAVNQRNKTLKELLNQIAHYNARVRKDALMGIKDLFSRHPKELECNAITTIQKLTSRFTDGDKAVRHALLLVLRETFSSVSKSVMKPIVSIVMAHLGTAMTHMANDIRLDAFAFLDLLLQHYSSLLIPMYTSQIFDHYNHFLGFGGSHNFDPNATLTVVGSLTRVLSVVSTSGSSDTTCTIGTCHRWSQKYDLQTLRPLHGYNSIAADISEKSFATSSVDSSGSGTKWIDISASLVDALLKCWAELAPTVCSSPLPDAVSLDCMVSITRCLCLLFEWLERSPESCQMKMELRHRFLLPCSSRLMASFPMSAPAVRTIAKIEECLCALNAGICETILHFVVAGLHDFDFTNVLQYYEGALLGKLLSLSLFSFSASHNKALDPYIKSLLAFAPLVFDYADINWKFKVLQAITNAFDRSTPESSIKLGCLTAMSKILLSESQDRKETQAPSVAEQFSKKWLVSFPRLLWELKCNQLASSKIVLEMLLRLGKFAVAGSTLATDFGMLQSAMIPFFCTVLPAKETPDKYLYGPFIKLPRDCQEIAVDVLYYFSGFQPFFLKALLACCLSPDMDLQTLVRLLEVVRVSFVQGRVEVANFFSFLLTLVVECSHAHETAEERKKHWIILGVVSRSLFQIGDIDVVMHLLAKPMSEHLSARPSPMLLASSLKVLATLSHDVEHVEVPELLLSVLVAQTASFAVSRLLAKDQMVMVIVRNAVDLVFKNKRFAQSLMKELALNLSGGKDQVYAVGVLTNEICKQKAIQKHLKFSDVSEIFRAVKTILKEARMDQAKSKQLFHLEISIRDAFGSQVLV
ncbi:testis-expressed protein 10 homolog isoform X1 [Selaginella moellendorffii]|uniref:testis-expressed protein 10 homolog isoform X1 n=1 Tax=Selaginella moellendorffii TaxID=88036 RepID=UPI000D1CD23A|nr:testis-expressed protein 10 homolog isoform X1 [Selaginella moellendorffii]|eukprot:XP_024545839.1 testis-expressed protein 10 homolog isoform X1 [Selaginella moellendorffii]